MHINRNNSFLPMQYHRFILSLLNLLLCCECYLSAAHFFSLKALWVRRITTPFNHCEKYKYTVVQILNKCFLGHTNWGNLPNEWISQVKCNLWESIFPSTEELASFQTKLELQKGVWIGTKRLYQTITKTKARCSQGSHPQAQPLYLILPVFFFR